MREDIGIYRGKRKDNSEWVEGCAFIPLARFGGETCIIVQDAPFHSFCYEVIPETVGEYTGLPDKNGKKIFEDDIVRADDYIFSIKYGKCGGTPNAETYGYMGFYLEAVSEGTKICAKYGLRDDMCYFTDIQVIGNIHDNPELL